MSDTKLLDLVLAQIATDQGLEPTREIEAGTVQADLPMVAQQDTGHGLA